MAANISCRNLGQRFISQICSQARSARPLSAPVLRKSMHTSLYDKEVEDNLCPAVVPDDVIQPESEKFWGPNPNSGVFGPASDQTPSSGGDRGFHTASKTGGSESVLEVKTFFRSLEDLDKPQHP